MARVSGLLDRLGGSKLAELLQLAIAWLGCPKHPLWQPSRKDTPGHESFSVILDRAGTARGRGQRGPYRIESCPAYLGT